MSRDFHILVVRFTCATRLSHKLFVAIGMQAIVEEIASSSEFFTSQNYFSNRDMTFVFVFKGSHVNETTLNALKEMESIPIVTRFRTQFLSLSGSPRFERPVFIVGPPRSGSTLFYDTLSHSTSLWNIGGEGNAVIETLKPLRPAARDFESQCLDESHAAGIDVAELIACYSCLIKNSDSTHYAELPEKSRPAAVRYLDKTPHHSLRIDFLNQIFPDAFFIFLHRDPRECLYSWLEAWGDESFHLYRELPDWERKVWVGPLVPGWRSLKGKTLPEVVTHEWTTLHKILLGSLRKLPPSKWIAVDFTKFIGDPLNQLARICRFIDISVDTNLARVANLPLAPSKTTVTSYNPDKWLKKKKTIEKMMRNCAPIAETLKEIEF